MKTKFTLFCLVFAFCTSTCITAYAQAVNKQDSLALVDLYNSTNGPAWNDNSGWLTGPVTTWAGITVTGTRVTGIALESNNLNGIIPASIGGLANLRFFHLDQNQLRGSLPSSLGNLANLYGSDLSFNQFSGSLPSSLGNLANLNFLFLGNNQFSGTIPSSIGNLANLTSLGLNDNQLSGSISSSLGNLVKLGSLRLSGNQLSGAIPSSLGNLVNLFSLYLNSNQLSGIPSSLGNLVHLQIFDLSNNRLSTIPSSFGNLTNLFELDLNNNRLRSIPSSLGNCANLIYLYLNNNQLSGSIPFFLGKLVNLGILNLGHNQLSNSIPSFFGKLVNLGALDLSHNKLSGKIPSSIAILQSLFALDLSHNSFTFDGMELIAQTFPDAIYSPQVRIPVHRNANTLSVSAGGKLSHNTYKWYRATRIGRILITAIVGDSVFHPLQKGVFFVRVFNSVATQLILYSDTIHYVPPAEFVESASSSEKSMLQDDKPNLFVVYPNPAKGILHVQATGKAILSLTDQSGKILLTQTIEGNGVISVASLPAGLYYLKNTSTGATQKVIIAK